MTQIFTATGVLPSVYDEALSRPEFDGWLYWEPETLWIEIERVFGTRPTQTVSDKLNALRTMRVQPDLFFHDAPTFENIILAGCGFFIDPWALQLATPEELVFGLEAWIPIANKYGTMQSFGREIITYVQVSCERFGLIAYPEVLKFAQPEYDSTTQRLVNKISPSSNSPTDESDIVAVQSYELYKIDRCVQAMKRKSKVTE